MNKIECNDIGQRDVCSDIVSLLCSLSHNERAHICAGVTFLFSPLLHILSPALLWDVRALVRDWTYTTCLSSGRKAIMTNVTGI